jgi:uncharacterized protein YbjT (DUF2867 family)
MKKLLLLGASGRTGALVMQFALERGYGVVVLVRKPADFGHRHKNLEIVEGTPYNPEDVLKAIKGCDAVISTLNNPRKSDLPWAAQIGPTDVLQRTTANALAAMKAHGVQRIIRQSTIGAGESMALAPGLTRFMVRHTNLKIVFSDHTQADRLLAASDTQWTSVRPVALTNSTKDKPVTVDYKAKPGMFVSRRNVAKFIVDCINDAEYFQEAPILSEK